MKEISFPFPAKLLMLLLSAGAFAKINKNIFAYNYCLTSPSKNITCAVCPIAFYFYFMCTTFLEGLGRQFPIESAS